MKKTARIITTFKCQRNCSYCVNKQPAVEVAKPLDESSIKDIAGYEEVLLTGGEPMLDPGHTQHIANLVKMYNPQAKQYLYTTVCGLPAMYETLNKVDGITFTVHGNPSNEDLLMLWEIQIALSKYPNYSNRLSIDKDVLMPLHIIPKVWNSVKIKGWSEDCIVPANEDLFVWKREE